MTRTTITISGQKWPCIMPAGRAHAQARYLAAYAMWRERPKSAVPIQTMMKLACNATDRATQEEAAAWLWIECRIVVARDGGLAA